MPDIDRRKKLSAIDEINMIHDLACTPLSQREIAKKYDVTPARVSQFKQEHLALIDQKMTEAWDNATGERVRSQEWRMREYEKDLIKMDNKRSPEFVKVRAQILKQIAEEYGQIAPRTQIAIIPAQHIVIGVDIDEDL